MRQTGHISPSRTPSARRAYYRQVCALQPGEFTRGWHDLAIRSRPEVARMLNISTQAVHQIERNAIRKIRLALIEWRAAQ